MPLLEPCASVLTEPAGPPGPNSWTQSLSVALITGQSVGFPLSARWRKSLSLLRADGNAAGALTKLFSDSEEVFFRMHARRLSPSNSRSHTEVRSSSGSPRHRACRLPVLQGLEQLGISGSSNGQKSSLGLRRPAMSRSYKKHTGRRQRS